MGFAILVLGLAVFVAGHTLTIARGARQAVVDRIGAVPYKLAYSLVAAIGIVLIGWGFAQYRASGWIDVWYPPGWTRHVTAALMWPAFVCVAAAYIPGQIKRTLKHPFLVGVK